MSQFGDQRREHILGAGRPMVLKRRQGVQGAITYLPLPITAFKNDYTPAQVEGAIRAGDARVEMTQDELAGSGWAILKVGTTDRIEIDGVDWTVLGAQAIYDGSLLIGWSVWVRGGP